MHYAEFAEDEVSHFVRLSTPQSCVHLANHIVECSLGRCDQGVRVKQVEGHWTESGQARKGMDKSCDSKPRVTC